MTNESWDGVQADVQGSHLSRTCGEWGQCDWGGAQHFRNTAYNSAAGLEGWRESSQQSPSLPASAEVQRAASRVRSLVAGDPCAGRRSGGGRRPAGQPFHRRPSNTVNGAQRRRRAAVLLILPWVPRWHPGALVRNPLLFGSTLVFWVSDVPITANSWQSRSGCSGSQRPFTAPRRCYN